MDINRMLTLLRAVGSGNSEVVDSRFTAAGEICLEAYNKVTVSDKLAVLSYYERAIDDSQQVITEAKRIITEERKKLSN